MVAAVANATADAGDCISGCWLKKALKRSDFGAWAISTLQSFVSIKCLCSGDSSLRVGMTAVIMAIESYATLQFEMLFYPVDISSGGSVPCVSGCHDPRCSIGLASD